MALHSDRRLPYIISTTSPREFRKNHDWPENLSATKGSHTTIATLGKIQLHLPLIPSIMNSYVNYNSEYRILICRQHKHAIPFKSIRKHFQYKHEGIPLSARQEILDYASSVLLDEPQDVIIPLEIIPPIHGLEIQKGYECSFGGCMLICGTRDSINKHGQCHVWIGENEYKWRELDVQKFFPSNKTRYYHLYMVLTSMLHKNPGDSWVLANQRANFNFLFG
jgi:Orsellinic acid/F9775 biosynthesis cluster protein D